MRDVMARVRAAQQVVPEHLAPTVVAVNIDNNLISILVQGGYLEERVPVLARWADTLGFDTVRVDHLGSSSAGEKQVHLHVVAMIDGFPLRVIVIAPVTEHPALSKVAVGDVLPLSTLARAVSDVDA